MKIVIVGAGGIGCKFGAMLAEAAEVWLVHHNEEHVAAIRGRGLIVDRDGKQEIVRVNAAVKPVEAGFADLVIILVKSYDTEAAVEAAIPVLREDTLVLTMQNGLGNLEKVSEMVGAQRAGLGVTFHGATLTGIGRVEDKGAGQTYLGCTDSTKERMKQVVETFNRAGIKTDLVANLESMLWAKLCVTAGINPVAAVLRVPNGALNAVPEARDLSLAAIAEAMDIARRKGISLAFDPIERFHAVTKATWSMCSGTLLDAMKGRRTEIDAISGGLVTEAKKLGMSAPVHQMLWGIVKAVEATHEFRV